MQIPSLCLSSMNVSRRRISFQSQNKGTCCCKCEQRSVKLARFPIQPKPVRSLSKLSGRRYRKVKKREAAEINNFGQTRLHILYGIAPDLH